MARPSRQPRSRRLSQFAALVGGVLLASLAAPGIARPAGAISQAVEPNFRNRPPQDQVIYFLLSDRFDNGDAVQGEPGHEFSGAHVTANVEVDTASAAWSAARDAASAPGSVEVAVPPPDYAICTSEAPS